MAEARRTTDASTEQSTVIGKGMNVKGEISGTAPVEVWGSIDGTTGTRNLVWVHQGGKVGGEINAGNVIVEGRVDGKITAEEKVDLRAACQVEGDISAKTVAIADGSFFQGHIQMQGDGKAPQQVRYQEKRKA